ncbi:MAG: type II secretion system protein [Alphaproteobacteria bacterium]|nr:type II secretion system protein [Alphaproteobacteria bacterium]
MWRTGSPAVYRSSDRRGRQAVDEAGFSLIEVLVAAAISAILLVPLFRNFSVNLDRSADSDTAIEATLIAESMIETLGARLPLTPGDSLADIGRFAVAASVQLFTGEGGGAAAGRYVIPYQLTVSVAWQQGHHRRSIHLQTVRLAPMATR